MALGDSLTSGNTIQGAYRNRLYSLLTGAGYNVDFIGTQTDSNNPTLPDRDHQGMGGYRIDMIQTGLPFWLNAIEDPDVVLLMIGTNDFSANFNVASAQTRLAELVSDIATKRPFAKIILSNLLLRTDSPSFEALQTIYNAAIPGIVNDQVALGRQVTFVDMHSALLPGDFEEGVHPTQAGYDKMADTLFPAVTSVMPPQGSANPPAIVRTEPPADLQHITIKFSKPLADSAANPVNFSLSGGLTVSQAVLDPITKRTITLTTSTQTPGVVYTLAVTGVRDRTPAQTQIAPGAAVTYSSYYLINGSFEAGETPWTMTGNYLVYANNAPYLASDGTKMVIMNGGQSTPNAVLSQTFATIPGQSYLLNFDIGILAGNFSEQALRVELTGASPLLSVTDSVFGNGLANTVWATKNHQFTANSATTTLTFRDQSPTSNAVDLLLDNVQITVTTNLPNTAPVAVADSYSTILGTSLVVPAAGVLTNDTDAQSNALSAVLNVGPGHGGLTLNANGGFTYTPGPGYTGTDSFTYHANDGSLDSNIVTVSIAVNAVPSNSLVNGSFEAGETGWTMTGNYLVYANSAPYAAFDGTTMVVMNGGQTPPNAVVSQSFTTIPGQPYKLDFNLGVLAGNFAEQKLGVDLTGAGSLLSQTESVFGNGQGNSVWSAKTYSFIADSVTTTLTFTDRSASSNGIDLLLDNVRVTSTGSPPNTAPVAFAESYSTNLNTPLAIPSAGVLANDQDAESNTLSAVLDAGPGHGGVILNPNGSFTYTPTIGYAGSDSFTYHANDGILNSNIVTVAITITAPIADALVNGSFESNYSGWVAAGNQTIESYAATDGTKVVAFNSRDLTPNALLTQTFSTVNGQTYTLTFDAGVLAYVQKNLKMEVKVTGSTSLVSQTITLAGVADGVIRWTAKSYTFVANSTTTTLSFRDRSTTTIGIDLLLDKVRVTGPPASLNTAPLAVADTYSTNKDTPLVVSAAGVLTNDSDPQFNSLTAVLENGPSSGSLILNANGSFSYTPIAGYTGAVSFTYHANDGSLNSNTVTVNIDVNGVSAGILVNPSFESGFSGWTTSGNKSIEFYPTTDGIRMVAFNSQNLAPNAVISQTFATTSGNTYTLTFDAGVFAYTTDAQTLQVSVIGAGGLLAKTVTLNGLGSGIIRWFPQTFTFTADSSSTTLTFRDQSTSTVGIDLLLDNVRVFSELPKSVGSLVLAPPVETLGTPSLTLSPGAAVIRMTAPQAGAYILECSEDLKTWLPIDSMQCGAQDLIEFRDTQDSQGTAPPKAKMFYRIGCQPAVPQAN
ncbi:MAG: Ig-like domain-containing protein [Luteolibacter sp.]